MHKLRNKIIVFCDLDPLGCNWNISSPDHSIFESAVFEILCEVQYSGNWWTPVIQCLPETSAEVVRNRVNKSITKVYSKTVSVTSQLDRVKFDCHVSFSSSNINSSDDIHLWTSPVINVINVTCKYDSNQRKVNLMCYWRHTTATLWCLPSETNRRNMGKLNLENIINMAKPPAFYCGMPNGIPA